MWAIKMCGWSVGTNMLRSSDLSDWIDNALLSLLNTDPCRDEERIEDNRNQRQADRYKK